MPARERRRTGVISCALGAPLTHGNRRNPEPGHRFRRRLLSFLSPCVLPLVPSYLTFITGMNYEDLEGSRRDTLIHALLFVIGFSLIFLALGAGARCSGS